ncbi:MAG: hypothetical protein U0792_20985 [Gemmataceae bacterium]
MLKLSTRQKCAAGIVFGTILASALIVVVISSRQREWPTPTQAREALAGSGWCKGDESIEQLTNGNVKIGDFECNLAERTWFRPGLFGRFRYVQPSLFAPFGRWEAGFGVIHGPIQ